MQLLTQGYQINKRKKHHDLVNPYNMAVSRLISDDLAIAKP